MRKSHLYLVLAAVLGFAQVGIPVVVAQTPALTQTEQPVIVLPAPKAGRPHEKGWEEGAHAMLEKPRKELLQRAKERRRELVRA